MKNHALLALALAAAAAACTLEEDTPDQGVPPGNTSRQVSAPDYAAMESVSGDSGEVGNTPEYRTAVPTPPTAVPDLQGGMTVTGQLIPVNRSGINGSVTATAVGFPGQQGGAGTLVSVALYEAQANTAYRVSINRGPCGSNGPVVAPVGVIQVGGTGSGAVSDTLALPATTVMNGQHAVTVSGSNAGAVTPPVACAEIPLNRPNPAPRG